ncbi:hypothetical protein KP509_07G085500 [Ceratopteris richardii]|uniref:Tubby C-terminal domain-containing protein n=1 Tax=Ceratopteris richardii TaxID=49495 RepID=A0A8T2UH06_CERRI|nr:hypothetical protein KP509_07G085500 [Ceratopteris richardii]
MSKPMRSFLSTQRSPPSCFSYEDPIECNLQTQSSQTKSRGQFSRKGSVGSPNSHTRKENLPPRGNVKPSPTKEKETSVADNCSRSHGSDGDTESRIQAARVLRRALRSLPQNHQSRYVDSKHKRPALFGICENGGDADSLPIFAASSTSSSEPRTPNHSLHVWEDDPECDVAPASSWSALANKYLLCRPLPLDIGRCACYILHEPDDSSDRPLVYSLYTDEGHGRQDRKLAVARHQRNIGRSEFLIAQNGAGTLHLSCDESFLGRVRSNIIGSRYLIWNEISSSECKYQGPGKLLGVVIFEPTVSTWTGSFRVMRAYVPKYQSIHMSLSNQVHNSLWTCRSTHYKSCSFSLVK